MLDVLITYGLPIAVAVSGLMVGIFGLADIVNFNSGEKVGFFWLLLISVAALIFIATGSWSTQLGGIAVVSAIQGIFFRGAIY